MRPLRYSINVTLDGCVDHRAIPADEELQELHRHHTRNLGQADALIFGRVTYAMMEAAWRPFGIACTIHDEEPLSSGQVSMTAVTPKQKPAGLRLADQPDTTLFKAP